MRYKVDNFFQGDAFTLVIKKFRKDRLLVAKRAACRIFFVHEDQVLSWLIVLINFRCLPRNVIFKISCVILAFSFFFKRQYYYRVSCKADLQGAEFRIKRKPTPL